MQPTCSQALSTVVMLPCFTHVHGVESLPHQTGWQVGGLSATIVTIDDCRILLAKHELAACLTFGYHDCVGLNSAHPN